MSALTFVVLCLATYRATRFIVADTLIDRQRLWWFKRFPPKSTAKRSAHKLGQLVECPFCIGFWWSGVLVGVVAWYRSVPLPLLVWPAVSAVVGLIFLALEPA